MAKRLMRLKAFSLLEMAIVLLIIAAVIGGSVSMFTGSLQKKQYEETNTRMDVIDKALLDFRRANDRLPCPGDLTLATTSSNFGVEAAKSSDTSTSCHGLTPSANFYAGAPIEAGLLPTKTLKLPDDYAFDSWGHRIFYVVDGRATITDAFAELEDSDTYYVVDGDTTTRIQIYPAGVPVGSAPAGASAPADGMASVDTGASVSVASASTAITIDDATARITVKTDASGGSDKVTNALYALVSIPDGHGTYPKEGGSTRINTGNTDPNVQMNCDCTVTGTDAGVYKYSTLAQTETTTDSYKQSSVVHFGTRQMLRRPGE